VVVPLEALKAVATYLTAAMSGLGVGALALAAMWLILRFTNPRQHSLSATVAIGLIRASIALALSMVLTLTFLFVLSIERGNYLLLGTHIIAVAVGLLPATVLPKRIKRPFQRASHDA